MKVLVADDDKVTRKVICEFLKKWDYEPVEAVNGKEAWDLLSQPDAPSLCLIDWVMPELSGIEICKKLAQLEPFKATQKIMLTGKNEKSDLIKALQVGANDYLTKPIDFDQLRVRLKIAEMNLEIQRQALQKKTTQIHRVHLDNLREMIYGATHEILNPLAIIAALTESIELAFRKGEAQEEKIVSKLKKILSRSQKINVVLKELRQFAKLDSKNAGQKIFYSEVLVNETLEGFQSMLKKQKVKVLFENTVNEPLKADLHSLQETLTHLIRNSLEAIEGYENEKVEIYSSLEDELLQIEVIDSGPGFIDNAEEHLFDPFFTTKSPDQHLGIGLNIADTLVSGLGGVLTIERKGCQTVARIKIPVIVKAQVSSKKAA